MRSFGWKLKSYGLGLMLTITLLELAMGVCMYRWSAKVAWEMNRKLLGQLAVLTSGIDLTTPAFPDGYRAAVRPTFLESLKVVLQDDATVLETGKGLPLPVRILYRGLP